MDTIIESPKTGFLVIPGRTFVPKNAFEIKFPHGENKQRGTFMPNDDDDEAAEVEITPAFQRYVIDNVSDRVSFKKNFLIRREKIEKNAPTSYEEILRSLKEYMFLYPEKLLNILYYSLVLLPDKQILEMPDSSIAEKINLFPFRYKKDRKVVVVRWNHSNVKYFHIDCVDPKESINGIFKSVSIFTNK
jgi:hypothetical protein